MNYYLCYIKRLEHREQQAKQRADLVDYMRENQYQLTVDDPKFWNDADKYYGDTSGMVCVRYL